MDNGRSLIVICIQSIAIILLCLLLFNTCQEKQKVIDNTKVSKVTFYKYFPKWYPLVVDHYQKTDSVPTPIPQKVDTAEIIRRFYMQYTFRDSIIDTNIAINSAVTVAGNAVLKNEIKYKLLQPQISSTVTIERENEKPLKPIILVGGELGVSPKRFISQVTPAVMVLTKKRQAFGYGYDILNNTHQAKVYLPLYK